MTSPGLFFTTPRLVRTRCRVDKETQQTENHAPLAPPPISWLFEDFPCRTVTHVDDIYAAVDAVASLYFGVVDGIYGSFLISSCILNCVRRYGQDCPELVPIRCRLVGVQ